MYFDVLIGKIPFVAFFEEIGIGQGKIKKTNFEPSGVYLAQKK